MLINKTKQNLVFGQKNSSKKKDDFVCVQAFTCDYFHPKDAKNKKYSIKTDGYRWSKPFNITTFGVSGQASVKRYYDDEGQDNNEVIEKYNPSHLDYGVMISSLSAPYGRTSAITLVPRYYLINESGRDLVITQGHKNATRQYFLKIGQKFTYHLEHKNDSSSKNAIKIRAPIEGEVSDDTLEDLDQFNPEDWSSNFTLEDINDFQVSFQDNPDLGMKGPDTKLNSILRSKNKERPKKPTWDDPNERNGYRRFIKVTIQTEDETTIFIIFTKPNMPEYQVNNFTDTEVIFYQEGLKDYHIERFSKPADKYIKQELNPLVKKMSLLNHKKNPHDDFVSYPVPYCWDDYTKDNKKLVLEIDGKRQSYEIEEIEEKKPITANGYKYYISVSTNGYYREVQITQIKAEEEEAEVAYTQLMSMGNTKTAGISMTINLKGMGISIVDEEPKELLYISIYMIDAFVMKESKMVDFSQKTFEDQEEYDLKIGHMQIDNVISKENPIIFSPESALDKHSHLTAAEFTPFIQAKISQTSKFMDKSVQRTVEALQLQIQTIMLEVETGTLMVIVDNVLKIVSVFNEEEKKDSKDNASRLVISDSMKPISRYKTFSKTKNLSEPMYISKPLEEICPELKAEPPQTPDLEKIKTNKIFFRLISIGAMKINLTLRIEKRALNFDLSKGFGVLTVLYTIFSSFLNISDAPLNFKSLILKNVCHTDQEVSDKLVKKFTSELIWQLYKIMGSSDIIGNPVGFVSKLGSGFAEFFSEPSKGLLKSPKEFGKGFYKGSKSLGTALVSASFSSASGISGSLYSILKNVSGQEIVYQRNPNTCWQGFYKGVYGGATEITEGVTGIVVKPYQGAKKGPFGLAKGVGKGICGFIVSPLT